MKEKTPKEFFKIKKLEKFHRNFNNHFTFYILNFPKGSGVSRFVLNLINNVMGFAFFI